MSREFKIVVPVAIAGTLIAFVAVYPYTDGGRQRLNLRLAEEHLPGVRAILESDARFKEVRAGVYTGQGGAIGLYGQVETPGDLLRLMRAVADERLPIAVHWQVQILSEV